MKCSICNDKLSCTEERDFLEAREINPGVKPMCDECYNMQDTSLYEPDIDQHSDADPGL